MWQHVAWRSARCVEGRAIRKEALSRLRLGEGKVWKTLASCLSNTQKVRERFCSALPFTHTSILTKFMQTTNTIALAKFVTCCQYHRTIYPPWSTFCLVDSLVPNECKFVNNKQQFFLSNVFIKFCEVGELTIIHKWNEPKFDNRSERKVGKKIKVESCFVSRNRT
jgi:hypothetical protein